MARRAAATFLGQLDPERRAELIGLGRGRRYPAHSVLSFEGDDAHDVLVIRAGKVKVSVTLEGREVVLDVLGPDDILGELSAIDGGPRSATATAATNVDVTTINAAAFGRFVDAHPAVAVGLLRSVTARLRDASRRQVEYGALDAVGRVCRRLLEMMERDGRLDGDGVVIDAPLSQSDIAAWAGLSREAVVKALHALRALGWVSTRGRTITIIDVHAVTTRAAISLG